MTSRRKSSGKTSPTDPNPVPPPPPLAPRTSTPSLPLPPPQSSHHQHDHSHHYAPYKDPAASGPANTSSTSDASSASSQASPLIFTQVASPHPQGYYHLIPMIICSCGHIYPYSIPRCPLEQHQQRHQPKSKSSNTGRRSRSTKHTLSSSASPSPTHHHQGNKTRHNQSFNPSYSSTHDKRHRPSSIASKSSLGSCCSTCSCYTAYSSSSSTSSRSTSSRSSSRHAPNVPPPKTSTNSPKDPFPIGASRPIALVSGVRIVHSYSPTFNGAIAVTQGEHIHPELEAEGFYLGTNSKGQRGLFPVNHAIPINPSTAARSSLTIVKYRLLRLDQPDAISIMKSTLPSHLLPSIATTANMMAALSNCSNDHLHTLASALDDFGSPKPTSTIAIQDYDPHPASDSDPVIKQNDPLIIVDVQQGWAAGVHEPTGQFIVFPSSITALPKRPSTRAKAGFKALFVEDVDGTSSVDTFGSDDSD